MALAPQIRLLGELEVLRAGRVHPLPASKKTRALLGYLAVTRRSHTREELCDLLWQGPDDPRAALRWSLAKLRDVLGAPAIVADRERVGLGPVETDLDAILGEVGRDHAAVRPGLGLEALRGAVARFRGELLEGLALPDCYRYNEWFTAERERARGLRIALVTELEARYAGNLEEALRWARERVALDPLSEAAHVRVIRLLADLGRKREAFAQYETCRRILADELGAKPSPALVEAKMYVGSERTSGAPAASAAAAPSTLGTTGIAPSGPTGGQATTMMVTSTEPDEGIPPLVGRGAELAAIEDAMNAALDEREGRVLLLQGEPGIGKTRLLREVSRRIRAAGGTVIAGRAFEAEMVRPYGPFIDGLRAVAADRVPEALRARLAALFPALSDYGGAADRASQFEAVTELFVHLSSSGPVGVLLDDLQWFDEASAALLHYIARTLGHARVFVLCAARSGELSDNATALRLVRGLSRDGRLRGLELGPLDPDATEELVRGLMPGVDASRLVADSAGNPLFACELARAASRGPDSTGESLGGLIAERLSRLDERARELASWAAALGRSFDLDTLERVVGHPPAELLRLVGELERHGIVRVSVDGVGYDFAHDLVRAGAYQLLSGPNRRMVHRHIARTLEGAAIPALSGDVAHHAGLGGETALAVRAALAAAQRCLRMFAGAEAARLAGVALTQLGAFSRDERLPAQLALLEVLVYSGTPGKRPEELKGELTRTVMEAQDGGRHDVATKGLNLLSVLQFDGGDLAGAHESTLRAADAAQAVDALGRARQLGASARCLGMLERDMDQAEAMYAEASVLADAVGAELMEVEWGGGVLRAFRGDSERAARSFERALLLARAAEDRWCEYECLRALVQLELEAGRPTDRCTELLAVASKMRDGSELPTARALAALDCLVRGDPAAEGAIESALESLRGADAKGMLAYVLVFAGERDVDAGRPEAAERRANEALRAAAVVNRQSQVALARAVLSRAAFARGDARAARRHLDAVKPALDRPLALSARARAAVIASSGHDAAARSGVEEP
jgi:DNA-binding SARP family transcriptional activator/tetratricopeptide (TPR) repeat protein